MITRRRFLTITAACALTPQITHAETWQGRAFGADVAITLHGPRDVTRPALRAARNLLREIEQTFSLYDPASDLSRLNASSVLDKPNVHMRSVMAAADDAYHLTGGLFDPTVQAIWQARARGVAQQSSGTRGTWEQVRIAPDRITLNNAHALTFNGIAQGYATDAVTTLLEAHGLSRALINIGEHRALGGPFKLGLEDPAHGYLGTRTLTGGAIATSSADATRLAGQGHILHRSARPRWSTVSVEADRAILADALSTGLVLASRRLVTAVVSERAAVTRITLVDADGNLETIT